MKEIWKDIKDYEGLYQVSNWGRVKSLNYHRMGFEKILKTKVDKDGYLTVMLNNPRKTFKVHRLVAEAFIPNSNNYPIINHKDENKQNNVAINLEWCDVKYNNEYNNGQKRRAIKRLKPILQYTLNNELVREWESAKQAEMEGGFNNVCICKCCKGHIKYHKGFRWSYKKEGE